MAQKITLIFVQGGGENISDEILSCFERKFHNSLFDKRNDNNFVFFLM